MRELSRYDAWHPAQHPEFKSQSLHSEITKLCPFFFLWPPQACQGKNSMNTHKHTLPFSLSLSNSIKILKKYILIKEYQERDSWINNLWQKSYFHKDNGLKNSPNVFREIHIWISDMSITSLFLLTCLMLFSFFQLFQK